MTKEEIDENNNLKTKQEDKTSSINDSLKGTNKKSSIELIEEMLIKLGFKVTRVNKTGATVMFSQRVITSPSKKTSSNNQKVIDSKKL